MSHARNFVARYTLQDGTQGVLRVIAHCSCDALVIAIDTFGDQLRTCSARPA